MCVDVGAAGGAARWPRSTLDGARVSAYTNARSSEIARTNLRDLCCCCFYVSHSLNTIFK